MGNLDVDKAMQTLVEHGFIDKDGHPINIRSDAISRHAAMETCNNKQVLSKLDAIDEEMTREQADSLGLSLVTNHVPVAMRNPLVILDGEEYHGMINDINVLDIDHIDIYKPGSTEANAYGDKGKHGVMKVFTKRQTDVITYIVNGNPATKSEFDRLSRSDIREIKILKRGTAAAMKASADGSTHDVYLVTTNK
jgi:hypothetical protein